MRGVRIARHLNHLLEPARVSLSDVWRRLARNRSARSVAATGGAAHGTARAPS